MQERTTAKMVIPSEDGSVPIKIWTEDVEPEALMQLKNLSRLPFIAKQGVACMPDVHAGKGSTIGTVIATDSTTSKCTVADYQQRTRLMSGYIAGRLAPGLQFRKYTSAVTARTILRSDMKKFIKENGASIVVHALLFTIIAGTFKLTYDADVQNQIDDQSRARRMVLERCVPNGYVAHAIAPMRTYRCDSGVYTWEDMK